ncbi:PREDICTED: uncharacterized protein LOC102013509 [Chinchilla lanigera]|uniref:uncharacterized protein LOC102013509 n=1 Tax=Chinchilla lanigera TaxID=34839 RepID=UPI00038EF4B0|nr:PREDICTED: uncharacterized protein LOC102013509 [Chinchilla lanigera]
MTHTQPSALAQVPWQQDATSEQRALHARHSASPRRQAERPRPAGPFLSSWQGPILPGQARRAAISEPGRALPQDRQLQSRGSKISTSGCKAEGPPREGLGLHRFGPPRPGFRTQQASTGRTERSVLQIPQRDLCLMGILSSHKTLGVSQAHGQSRNGNDTPAAPADSSKHRPAGLAELFFLLLLRKLPSPREGFGGASLEWRTHTLAECEP